MKASELITKLSEAITETGADITVYFDTEAAQFDVHLVEISDATLESGVIDERDFILLKCSNDLYNHTRDSK